MHVWIIEILDKDKWLPTVGCSLTREDAQIDLLRWKWNCPDDKFRIRKYERKEK